MTIDIHTRLVTLLGTPLSQSFAARMQNRAYEAMGLNLLYFYTETDSEHLGEIVRGLRHLPMAGFAVTKPNKVKVLSFLDELDPLCRAMGSCNTVVCAPGGRLIGYNTDGSGFLRSLTREGGVTVQGGRFFCLGSGGAGRAIAFALAQAGAERVFLSDVSEAAGRELEAAVNAAFPGTALFVGAGNFRPAADCAVLINASGVGMGRSAGQSPFPKDCLRPEQLCFDACYNPARTQFLLDAEERGCRVLNGLGMSLYQGAAQIALWAGRQPPLDVMRRELEEILAGR